MRMGVANGMGRKNGNLLEQSEVPSGTILLEVILLALHRQFRTDWDRKIVKAQKTLSFMKRFSKLSVCYQLLFL